METPRHCPHLGLKQNRAIRFASPTPEHRCYVTGDMQDIPVEQAGYCLSSNHVNCPLYMGLSVPSTPKPEEIPETIAPRGFYGWILSLSVRDRVIYSLLLLLLVCIVGFYVATGFELLTQTGQQETPIVAHTETSTSVAGTKTETSPALSPTATASATRTPTRTPTTTRTPTISASPTQTSGAVLPGTLTRTPAPTLTATPSAVSSPPTPVSPTPVPPTPVPPTPVPPTPVPPTSTPQPVTEQEFLTLYFADTQTSLLVPVTRRTMVTDKRVATTAMQELIAGPRNGLRRLVESDVQVLDVSRQDDTIIVNLSKSPGADLAFYSIALTLSEFSGVSYVQVQVNGTNIGPGEHTGPIQRPILNVDNPQGLPTEYASGTRFLPLYFLNGDRYARITRLVPRTNSVAKETVEQLLAGPGQYGDVLTSPIPAGTELLEISKDGSTAVVNLSETFTNASNRDAALNALVLSVTELRDIASGERIFQDVVVQVAGHSLAEFWGESYGRSFPRPALNPE